jgi:hypothetical protein
MKIKMIAAALLAIASVSAFADDHCTREPRSKWLTTDAVKAKVEQQGMTVQRIETDDNCYEVRAVRRNGDRVKLTVHPVTAAVMEEDIKYAQPASAPAR